MQAGLVVSELACNHWDLGSIPRSPKTFVSYFFQCDHMQAIERCSSYALRIQTPNVLKAQSNGHGMDDHHVPSQSQRSQLQKSKQACVSGLHNSRTHLLLGPTPPWFLFLFSFFLFSFNNYYYYYLINS